MSSVLLAMTWMLTADVFADAARAQLEGKHAEAIKAYEQLNKLGTRNADVEFNLGTSLAESGDFGLGMLHLLRSQRLRPAEDVNLSLTVLREKVLKQKTQQTGRETDLFADIADQLGRAPLEPLLFLTALIFGAGLVWRVVWAQRAPNVAQVLVIVGFSLLVVVGGLVLLRQRYSDERPAAVIVKRTTAREGPDERFRALGSLLSGEEVRLARGNESASHRGVWLSGGKLAFVPKESVELVEDWNVP